MTAKAKARVLKFISPFSKKFSIPKIKSLPILRKNKVEPIYHITKQNENRLLRENSLSFGRRDGEYLQARRAVLSSYHLVNGGGRDSFKEKMQSSLKGLCRHAGKALQARVGVRVYMFKVGIPWRGSDQVLVFRCFLPHLKATNKPCMDY